MCFANKTFQNKQSAPKPRLKNFLAKYSRLNQIDLRLTFLIICYCVSIIIYLTFLSIFQRTFHLTQSFCTWKILSPKCVIESV